MDQKVKARSGAKGKLSAIIEGYVRRTVIRHLSRKGDLETRGIFHVKTEVPTMEQSQRKPPMLQRYPRVLWDLFYFLN